MREDSPVRVHVPGDQGGTAPAAAQGLRRPPGRILGQGLALLRMRHRIAPPGCRRPRPRRAFATALAARPEPADGSYPVVTARTELADPPASPGRGTGT